MTTKHVSRDFWRCGFSGHPVLYAVCVMFVLITAFARFAYGEDEAQPIALIPIVEISGPAKTLTLWQLPPQGRVVRKVLVLLHPTTSYEDDYPIQGPYAFWDNSPSCPLCSGQPESRQIVIEALSRDYAVLVPTPIGFPYNDWTGNSGDGSWPQDSAIMENTVAVISEFLSTHGLEDVPIVGFGMSAGGDGITTLALREGLFDSIVVMISGGTREAYEAATENYPPTFFVTMPKDNVNTAESYSAYGMAVLRSKGVATEKISWYEHPLTPDWFSILIREVNLSTSEAIFSTLKAHQLLDENDYIICAPQVCEEWAQILRSANILPNFSTLYDRNVYESRLLQELSVAFAFHVTLSRTNDEVFAWFEQHSRADSRRDSSEPHSRSYTSF